MAKRIKPQEHIFIPDSQVRPGVPTNHLRAAGNYIADKMPSKIIVAMDWYDLPSLAGFDRPGHVDHEGQRLVEDVQAGDEAWYEFTKPFYGMRKSGYRPEIHLTMGNHEYRLIRCREQNPRQLQGLIGYEMLEAVKDRYTTVHDFLEIVELDGVLYSHYFVNPQSLMRGVLGGGMDNRLNKVGQSFTQGHQQTLMMGNQPMSNGHFRYGCVAGAFYQHEEKYLGPQGKNYWRGCVYKHEVQRGEYDIMLLSLDYLVRAWS